MAEPDHRSILEIADELQVQLHQACNHRAHPCPCLCGCAAIIPCDCWSGPDGVCGACQVRIGRGDDEHAAPDSPAGRMRAAILQYAAAWAGLHRARGRAAVEFYQRRVEEARAALFAAAGAGGALQCEQGQQ